MQYPIYIPSKGRWDNNLTAPLLDSFGLKYFLVVEDNEYNNYVQSFGANKVLKLNGSNFGCVAHARNFIKNHALINGHEYHWQLDDDVDRIYYHSGGIELSNDVDFVLSNVEKFINKYKNVGASSLSANTFGKLATKPYSLNNLPYTVALIRFDLPYQYTSGMNEDTDFAFQILSSGYWCTIRFSAFLFSWKGTGTRKGGYTEIYANDGREKRQRALLKKWPQMNMKMINKYKVTSLKTAHIWRRFTQPLLLK